MSNINYVYRLGVSKTPCSGKFDLDNLEETLYEIRALYSAVDRFIPSMVRGLSLNLDSAGLV
jgi:hypothetical protein